MLLDDRKPVAILAACAAAGLLVGFLGDPGYMPDFTICSFKLITGLPCPGCGMTRAVIALAHGELTLALMYNPFVLAVFPGMLMMLAYPLVMNRLSPAVISLLDRIFIRSLLILLVMMILYNFYRWYVIFTVGGFGYI